jgi:predicted metal-dependent hydrolase
VRISTRAKRRKLSLSYSGELEVILPLGYASDARSGLLDRPGTGSSSRYDLDDITDFLEQNRNWIERAVQRTIPERTAIQASREEGLPTSMTFEPLTEHWRVDYQHSDLNGIRIGRPAFLDQDFDGAHYALTLSGAVDDEGLCRLALQRFVLNWARQRLPQYVQGICDEIGATPGGINVKRRKTSWGTCSSKGLITVDARILLLPKNLARQVVLHEAAHLSIMDHSPQFYQRLYSFPGSSEASEKALKKASALIPAWLSDPPR